MTRLNDQQNLIRKLEENYNQLINLNLDKVTNTFTIYKEVGELCFRIKEAKQYLATMQETKQVLA